MAKISNKPQDDFTSLTENYLKVFGSDLVSLILYGSAAGGSYIKDKSDINLLIVLTPDTIDKLADAFSTIKYWRKRGYAIPLMMTKPFISSSLDSYPIEFINMKNNHILIYGEDILEQIDVNKENLRLQIERELKGKLLLLRQGYLEIEGKPRHLKKLISHSFTAIISIFNALLYYKKGTMPSERRNTISELAEVFEIDTNTLLQCADIKEGIKSRSGEDITVLFLKYIFQIAALCDVVDSL